MMQLNNGCRMQTRVKARTTAEWGWMMVVFVSKMEPMRREKDTVGLNLAWWVLLCIKSRRLLERYSDKCNILTDQYKSNKMSPLRHQECSIKPRRESNWSKWQLTLSSQLCAAALRQSDPSLQEEKCQCPAREQRVIETQGERRASSPHPPCCLHACMFMFDIREVTSTPAGLLCSLHSPILWITAKSHLFLSNMGWVA